MKAEIRTSGICQGKGLFSTCKILVDDVIFVEKPLVSCQFAWNEHYKYRACSHCLRPLETAEEEARHLTANTHYKLPHPEWCETDKKTHVSCDLCGEKYCSNECKVEASGQYHQVLCMHTTERNLGHPLEHLIEAWKQIQLPPETNNIMLIVRLLAMVLQTQDKAGFLAKINHFCNRTENENEQLVHKLLGDKFVNQIDDLNNLLRLVIPNEGIEEFLSPAGFRKLLALVGTNSQGIASSAISRWVENSSKICTEEADKEQLDKTIDQLYTDIDAFSGPFIDNEGVGLYILQSACNHSCSPNAEVKFEHNNNTLSLVALKDIEANDEIFISYLDPCVLARSKSTRRKVLEENYLFTCHCERCELEDDDAETSEDDDDDPMED